MKNILKKFKYRKIALAVADAFIIIISALISNFTLTLLDDGISRGLLAVSMMVSVICCSLSLSVFGAYNKLWRYFNKKDYFSCVYGITAGIFISCILTYITWGTCPLRYAVLHWIVAMTGICTFRFIFKTTFIDLVESGKRETKYKRTMMIGGGQACKMLIKEILNTQNSPHYENKSQALFEPVCIIDDDRHKIGTEIDGVQIVGTTAEIQKFINEKEIEQILFCIPSCIKEELLMNEEGLQKTSNKLIFIGKQIDINPEQFILDLRKLRDAALENKEDIAVAALHDMVPTFITPEEFNKKALLPK